MNDPQAALRKKVEQQARRMKVAEREHGSLMAQTVYMGTLGMLLILPTFVGAYLGLWLDQRAEGYSVSWTVSLIVLGLMLGAFNVYWFIRDRQ